VIASSEMDVYVAWSDEEGYEKQVEYETYPGIEKGEADSERGDYGSDNNSPLGETHDVGVKVFLDKTMPARSVPPNRVQRNPCGHEICTVNSYRGRREGVQPKQRGGKRDETDGQEEKNVDPQEYSVALFDIVKLVVVANPVHA